MTEKQQPKPQSLHSEITGTSDADLDALNEPFDLARWKQKAHEADPSFDLAALPLLHEYLTFISENFPDGYTMRDLQSALRAQVERAQNGATQEARAELSAALPALLSCPDFNFLTGQESDWLIRAASDGKRMTNYRRDLQRGALIYEQSGGSHRVELKQEALDLRGVTASGGTSNAGESLEMNALEWLVTQQNADFGFTFFYIARLLAPPEVLPANRAAVGWIDLDDVAQKIGYDLDRCTAEEREALRAQVWQFLNFGARALVIGQRRQYLDRHSGKPIETRVESPPWRILDIERPVQTAMFGETPRRVQLLISKEWEPLLTAPQLAQYLPFAEIVGTLPTKRAAGAWARVIGMALANFWRRLPHEATGAAPTIQPTRRELLERYSAKKSPPLEILASDKPNRALQYWRDALEMLVDKRFLSPEGEPARSVDQMRDSMSSYKWQEDWLNERVDLRPGPVIIEAIEARALAKHKFKPRALGKPKRKTGRPKKKPVE